MLKGKPHTRCVGIPLRLPSPALLPRAACRRRAPPAAAASSQEPAAPRAYKSIKEFIQAESPCPGWDGKFREQACDANVEAGCIAVAPAALPVPGAHGLHRVSASLLDNLAADQGRVIIAAIENGTCLGPLSGASARSAPGAAGGGFLKPVAPSKGSYAVLCQVVGVQRLGEGGMVRLRAEERVAVQALSGNDIARLRAQAAVLRDRWAYFVRAAAVEEAATAAASSSGAVGAVPPLPDVASALANCRDVAEELTGMLRDVDSLLQRCGDAAGDDDASELSQLLDWALQGSGSTAGTPGATASTSSNGAGAGSHASVSSGGHDSASLDFGALWRLSFAPFALSAAALEPLGVSEEAQQAARLKAMEATDLGLRLEAAADWAKDARARLQAAVALRRGL